MNDTGKTYVVVEKKVDGIYRFVAEVYDPHHNGSHHCSALVCTSLEALTKALPALDAMPRFKVRSLDGIAAALRTLGFPDAHYVNSRS